MTKTDDGGGATLRIAPGRAVAAFIVPPEGSFAIAHVEGKPSDREDIQVALKEGQNVATLTFVRKRP